MSTAATHASSARIAVLTSRAFSRMAFQCGHLEAQDVLADCGEVDLIELQAEPGFPRRQQWIRRLMYRDVTRRLAYANPGLRPVRLTGQYDAIVVMCQTYWDFLNVNAIEDWKDHCRTSICWIDELWASSLPLYKYWLRSLRRFDHVVVGMNGTVAPLSDALGQACHYVPGAVDAIRFSPFPDPPDRAIDVYSVGRRWNGLHATLLRRAEANGAFYVYDTLQTGESQTADHRQHRNLYANTAKRSRFFVVAPGKVNVPEETRGQIEVGFRYYEGAAAGAVMIGQPPECEAFRAMFDWPDVVVRVNADGSNVDGVLGSLMAQPGLLQEISQRNAEGALLRHDWIHRWKRIFEIAGVRPPQGMQAREIRLKELAEHARVLEYGR
jgi:Glycosyl transferases group 1